SASKVASLCCRGRLFPEVNALVGRTTVETQIQVLGVAFLHRMSNLLGHAHGEGQVAAHLPDHDGCSDVLGLDLHVLPGNLLHHAQSVGPVAVAAILGAVGERCRQVVRLCVVHLLLNAFLNLNMAKIQFQTFSKTMNPVTFCTAHQTLTGTKYTTYNTILAFCNA
uniref:Uncharacterized protein n=1 Tax=Poecilia reticulata TaxID=8081 RepID=A0A3P9NIP0_POERE